MKLVKLNSDEHLLLTFFWGGGKGGEREENMDMDLPPPGRRQFSLSLGKALTFSRIQPLKWAEESFFYNAQQIQVDILSSLPGLAYCQLCSLIREGA